MNRERHWRQTVDFWLIAGCAQNWFTISPVTINLKKVKCPHPLNHLECIWHYMFAWVHDSLPLWPGWSSEQYIICGICAVLCGSRTLFCFANECSFLFFTSHSTICKLNSMYTNQFEIATLNGKMWNVVGGGWERRQVSQAVFIKTFQH